MCIRDRVKTPDKHIKILSGLQRTYKQDERLDDPVMGHGFLILRPGLRVEFFRRSFMYHGYLVAGQIHHPHQIELCVVGDGDDMAASPGGDRYQAASPDDICLLYTSPSPRDRT